ncbi:hypothetical protein XOCgx_4399 [Xanthomonas oryzae pv. oryzicola]|nr:hypothetical protein XOCgx_4399 [Xanthomonas oryzae pv. oryzicola]
MDSAASAGTFDAMHRQARWRHWTVVIALTR